MSVHREIVFLCQICSGDLDRTGNFEDGTPKYECRTCRVQWAYTASGWTQQTEPQREHVHAA